MELKTKVLQGWRQYYTIILEPVSIGTFPYVVFLHTWLQRQKPDIIQSMMNEQRNAVIWGMNGTYYDAVMNRIPAWVLKNPDMIEDWFFAEIGL